MSVTTYPVLTGRSDQVDGLITSSSGSSGGFDPATKARFYSDFAVFNTHGWASAVSGSGATVQDSNLADSNRPGQVRLRTGSTTTGRAVHYLNSPFYFGTGFTLAGSVYCSDLSTVAEEYVVYLGMKQDITSLDGTHGIYFKYDRLNLGVNWHAVCDDDTGTTATDTGVAFSAATWMDLKIVMNDTYDSCAFYIDGTLVATNTTTANFPDADTDTGYLLTQMEKTAGTTERILYHDYHFLEFTVSR